MYFERFRDAVARLPAGLIRIGPPGRSDAIENVETALGSRLPPPFRSFLLSFDGADLFHEAVLVAGTGDAAPRRLLDLNANPGSPELPFAEAADGSRFAFSPDGRVWRIRSGSDERWLAGTDFSRWLDALVAHERPLYGADGEFSSEAFEPDGSAVLPRRALKQAEQALRFDPDAAEWHHERGVAFRRLGLWSKAKDAFARAAALDPDNPWPSFDRGRAALALGTAFAPEALAAFEAAARLESGIASARMWIWGARAALQGGHPERVSDCRREALAIVPTLGDELRRGCAAAQEDGDPEESAEAEALLAALEEPIPRARARLPILSSASPSASASGLAPGPSKNRSLAAKISDAPAQPARRTPPPDPRRPGRAGPPPPAGSRASRRR